jgi:outer membrane receptor protein involved in Fe transport
VQWSRPLGFLTSLSVGGDVRHMVGELQENLYTGGVPSGRRVSGGTQQVGGAFIAGVVSPVEALRIEASARVDAWRSRNGSRTISGGTLPQPTVEQFEDKSNTAFAPRLGVRFAPVRSFALRGTLFRAFRAPSLSEEYRTIFAGPNQLRGNPALGPEYLDGYDAGFDWQPSRMLEVRATVFRNFYRDLASFISIAPNVSQRQNVGSARSQGVEGEVALHPLPGLTVAGSYNYDDARVTSGATSGRWVNRVPEQRAAGRVTYASHLLGTLTAITRYEGMNHTLQGARLAPFAVVDLHARREILHGAELFVGVENLLDREYTVNYSGVLESLGMPRTVRAGAAVRSF